MADLLHIKQLLLHTSSSSSPFSLPPLHISPLIRPSPRTRRFPLSKLSPHSIPPKLHLISSLEHCDGSLLFKFGDESEIVEEVETPSLDDVEDEGDHVEIEIESESTAVDAVISNLEVEEIVDVVNDGDVEVNVIDTTSLLSDDVKEDGELRTWSDSSVADVVNGVEITAGEELEEILEESGGSAEDELDHSDVIATVEVQEFVESEIVEDSIVNLGVDQVIEDSKVDVVSESDVFENSEGEVAFGDKESDESVEDEVSYRENGEEEVDELVELLPLQLAGEPIVDEEVDNTTSSIVVLSEDLRITSAESSLDSDSMADLEISTAKLSMSQAADSSSPSSEVNDAGRQGITGVEDDLCGRDISDVVFPGSLGSTTSGTTSTKAMSDSALSGDMSVTVSLPHPSKANDATLSAVLLSDDAAHGIDIPEPEASSNLESNRAGQTASAVSCLDSDLKSMETMTATLSLPSSAAPLPDALEVNNVAVPAILKSDDESVTEASVAAGPVPETSRISASDGLSDLKSMETMTTTLSLPSSAAPLPDALEVNNVPVPAVFKYDDEAMTEASAAAGPVPETSRISVAETNLSLNRVEISAPSLSLVLAAASLTHSAQALAGGDDALFICENWFGVADGVGQWSFGGINKGLYAQEFMQNCEKLVQKSDNTGLTGVKELLQQSATMTEAAGSARVLLAHVTDQVFHVANIGDSGFIIIRNGNVFQKSSPMFHEFYFPYAISSDDDVVEAIEEYQVELEDGDIIVTATDGLFDNLYDQEIASLVSQSVENGKNIKELAELLASKAHQVGSSPSARTPFADAAQAAGHMGICGGKFDHVTVIVSAVQKG